MNSKIIPFEYGQNEVKVIQDDEGDFWFVAKDVCDVLGLVDVSMTVDKLDEDEKLVQKVFVSGQDRDVWTVSESGLYTLIIRSNKEAARPFRRWVTHEVLPAIRKTGRYAVPGAEEPDGATVEAIGKLGEILDSVNAAVRGLASAYGVHANGAGDCLPGHGAATRFGVRPVSKALMMRDESVRDFLESCCLIHPDASCRPMELHEAYEGWCKDARVSPLGRNTFYRSVRDMASRMIFTSQSVPDENGGITCIRVAHGICLNRTGRYYAVASEGGAA